MKRLMFPEAVAAGLTIAVLSLGACSDSGSNSGITASQPNSPIPGFSHNEEGPSTRVVEVCKDAPDDPGQSFDFTASANTGNGTLTSAFSLLDGECQDIWFDDSDDRPETGDQVDPFTVVTVVETVPGGWQLDKIEASQDADVANTLGATFSSPIINVGTKTVDVEVNFFHGATMTFFNSEVFVPGIEGCTPGFWKNNTGQWDDTGFDPGDDFDTVFGVDLFTPDISLLDALKLKGGGVNAMARHAVAALLNDGDPDVDASLSGAEVIALVQAAAAGGTKADFTSAKNTLETANELGCPLSADESNE